MKTFVSALAGLMMVATAAIAGGPAAIVEEIEPARADIAAMQYVERGRIIDLGKTGSLVLGYLNSCLREHITGGIVTVGSSRSNVTGGRATTERVECDGGALILTAEQAAKSGVLVFRKPMRGATQRP
ncbi:MAG: hypothetical protein O3C34_05085 [Proteobacteria bacterium]|nr:hypothetical protein [Pseudomonadota bacterium]